MTLLALLAAGCGGPTSSWTYNGAQVDEVEKSLSQVSERFRSMVTELGVEVTLPEDAGCYLQVRDDDVVTEDVLCGPFRFIGQETQWVTAPLSTVQLPDEKVRLVMDEDDAFDLGTANPNATPRDAQGDTPDLDRELEAPIPPATKLGTVIPLAVSDSEAEPFDLATVDATYTISAVGVTDLVWNTEGEPLGAPDGGALVTLKVERAAHQNVPTSPTSSAVLRAGGEEYEVPEGLSAIAVPGDGSDAVIEVAYGENVQRYSVPEAEQTAGTPFAVQDLAPINAPQSQLIGDESSGASTSYEFRVRGGTSTWSEEDGWAPEGSTIAYLDVSFRQSTQFREGFGTVDYDDTTYELTALSLTANGKSIEVPLDSVSIEPKPDGDWDNLDTVLRIRAEVPFDISEMTVSAEVSMTATLDSDEMTNYQRERVDGEPESITEVLELTEVTLAPQD